MTIQPQMLSFTFEPFQAADTAIQIHIVMAVMALGVGPLALMSKQRGRWHKCMGYLWVLMMAGTALSSFFITGFRVIGPFSPLHLLAGVVLWGLWAGVRAARRGNIAAHRAHMRNLYWCGVALAGAFTFLPGRVMNRVFFPGNPDLGYAIVLLFLVMIGGALWRSHLLPVLQKTLAEKT